MKFPKRLYKYRAFSGRSIANLVEDQLYFADPSTFNDPLDTKPTLETDLESDDLERMLSQLVEQRVNGEMMSAAKTIKYRGPKTLNHIASHSRKKAQQLISDVRYNATNPEFEFEDPLQFLLGKSIEQELLRRYDKGIFSLAERDNCPLMWSHYGDQHRGIAIGYSVPAKTKQSVFKMKYGGSSMIEASKVSSMLNGDEEARRVVDDAVLLKKAQDWRYEKEWRLIGQQGIQDSPMELEEIVFGMRCPQAVVYSVIKALEGRPTQVKFFEIRRKSETFLLKKYSLDVDELAASLPRRALSIYEEFEDLS